MRIIKGRKYYSISEVRLGFNKLTGMNKPTNSFINMLIHRYKGKIKSVKFGDAKTCRVYVSEEDKDKIIEYFWLWEQRRRINTEANEKANKITKKLKDIFK